MKRILITGTKSFVGTNVAKWLHQFEDNYVVENISLRNESWRSHDFSCFDVVLHVAGIAHVSTKKSMEEKYYRINRDLTTEVAKKAKADGVKQFIFMSSIIVYGDSSKEINKINKETVPNPRSFYGISKLQAEEAIKGLESKGFKIVIIRPPMIYGRGAKGNYPKLSKLARIVPIFPDFDNQRSMLHVDNLCEFIRLMIEEEEEGLFFPQNSEYVKTSELVGLIADIHGKKIKLTKMFNFIIHKFGLKFDFMNKLFGNLAYDKKISEYRINYRIRSLKESIELTELEGKCHECSNS